MPGPFIEDMAFTAPWVVVEDAARAAADFASIPASVVEVGEVEGVTGLASVAVVLAAERSTAKRRFRAKAVPPATTGRFAVPYV
jgi:hypothetical protein